MTITVTPEIEELLNAEARRLGKTPEQVALDRLSRGTPSQPGQTHQTGEELAQRSQAERVYALMGTLAHLGPSRLMQDKAEEKLLEERRGKREPENTGA